ncbi:MAG TPA: hypothetical protein ENJ80_15955 [Gammaproteobacteria bacterium]|nr:hypothetical protein [Gammaproteobacteria bacterium]
MDSANRKILVYQPLYVWLAVAVLAVLLVVVAYGLFEYGVRYSGTRVEQLTQQRNKLESQVGVLQKQNAELQEQVAMLRRSSEIDRRATREVRDEFAALRNQLMEQRKDLEFYRGIVSPGDAEPGLRIQRFQLEPAGGEGNFFYSLTLTQVKRNDRYVRGVVEMEVEGEEDGSPKVLVFNKLAADNSKPLSYKFRYFQNFEGEIWIPPQFTPQRIRIMLKPKGKGQPAGIDETMDWPA